MATAIAEARKSLPEFWQVAANPKHGERLFSLKVKITDGKRNEYFWLIDLKRRAGKVYGTINNKPEIVRNIRN